MVEAGEERLEVFDLDVVPVLPSLLPGEDILITGPRSWFVEGASVFVSLP
jgi:hypothetical protein